LEAWEGLLEDTVGGWYIGLMFLRIVVLTDPGRSSHIKEH